MSKSKWIHKWRDMDKKSLIEMGKEVVASLPNPFGSFEKATYILKGYHSNNPASGIYSFTTTAHNTEDCIEIMKKVFLSQWRHEKYCRILKIQNGKTEMIYEKLYSEIEQEML